MLQFSYSSPEERRHKQEAYAASLDQQVKEKTEQRRSLDRVDESLSPRHKFPTVPVPRSSSLTNGGQVE
jgi:hypothetical protein